GYLGRAKTYDLLVRNYIWPKLQKDVDCYVRNCYVCQFSKVNSQNTHRLLYLTSCTSRMAI
ncbi:hypothetical protein K440DRAFT_561719, partial [Wilcoxina mikolae CBS 423.85]